MLTCGACPNGREVKRCHRGRTVLAATKYLPKESEMKTILIALSFLVVIVLPAYSGPFDDLLKKAPTGISTPGSGPAAPDQKTTASGLKEALAVGTENAVKSVSKIDGYFGSQLIKILLPEKLQQVANVLSKLGFQDKVDNLILAMNRAAETAAPKAASLFGQAIRDMTFEDAKKILQGGETSATDYFKGKTSAKLYKEFKPVVSSAMNKVGTVQAYKEMMKPADSLPFVSKESVDLDHYVTNKALDGLFIIVGQEEKKIRTNPAARVTDLLKTVFGR